MQATLHQNTLRQWRISVGHQRPQSGVDLISVSHAGQYLSKLYMAGPLWPESTLYFLRFMVTTVWQDHAIIDNPN